MSSKCGVARVDRGTGELALHQRLKSAVAQYLFRLSRGTAGRVARRTSFSRVRSRSGCIECQHGRTRKFRRLALSQNESEGCDSKCDASCEQLVMQRERGQSCDDRSSRHEFLRRLLRQSSGPSKVTRRMQQPSHSFFQCVPSRAVSSTFRDTTGAKRFPSAPVYRDAKELGVLSSTLHLSRNLVAQYHWPIELYRPFSETGC